MVSRNESSDRDRDRRVAQLFDEASLLPADRQQSFLREACAGDESVRIDVQRLLDCDRGDDSFLEQPARSRLASDAEHSPPDLSGISIGPYRVVSRIGEGGMGVVYLAEQPSLRRPVALKIMRSGTLFASAVRRFQHEGQVLAVLEHPGIAKIFEAGIEEIGGVRCPFFAMEYVPGLLLLDYVEKHSPATRERLRLFLQICDAIQHAHLKGVIHRDLKPGNIMVDEAGRPKVLDFGVARASGELAPEMSLHTQPGQIIGTLPYMSPEQAGGRPEEIDSRVDIYSLGVILYELLTGELPYDLVGKSIEEAVSTIRHVEPITMTRFDRSYRGDLSTIVGKCLSKERDRRYQTVSELSADLLRYLRNEPILARAPSAFYVLTKYSKRHKALIAGMGATCAALLLGTVVSLWQASAARQEAARLTIVRDFLLEMLQSPNPDLDGESVRVIDVLDRAAARVGKTYRDHPDLRILLQEILAGSYNTLGQAAKAKPLMEEALATSRALWGDDDRRTLAAVGSLADICSNSHDFKQCIELGEDALRRIVRQFGTEDPLAVSVKATLGRVLVYTKERERGVRYLEEAVQQLRERYGEEARSTIITELDLVPHVSFGEQEVMLTRILSKLDGQYPPYHPFAIRARFSRGMLLQRLGRHTEAEAELRSVLELQRGRAGRETSDTITLLPTLAASLMELDRLAEATDLLEESVVLLEQYYGADTVIVAQARYRYAGALERLGRRSDAEREYLSALAILEEKAAPTSPLLNSTRESLVAFYEGAGDTERAAAHRMPSGTSTPQATSRPRTGD